ncbi:protein of unknown function [Bradyrhizobium vignae]|uniref:Uncharacterized protein n=1 Tax=Bradyrhizobium vignae TaxID=1549949 RepID=A0A2U3PSB2_9BRAD|nr:protein of unknown function [Bradyrhizobium vignae]
MGCGTQFCSMESQKTVCIHTVPVDVHPIRCAIYRQPKPAVASCGRLHPYRNQTGDNHAG